MRKKGKFPVPSVEWWDKPVRRDCTGRKTQLGQQEKQPLKHSLTENDRNQTAGKEQSDHMTLRGRGSMPAIAPSHLQSVGKEP